MESISDVLHWDDMQVCKQQVSAGDVRRGKHVRFVMNAKMQYTLLDKFFPSIEGRAGDAAGAIWLEHAGKKVLAEESMFCARVGSMIRRRGFLANLSMRENLLLPFLYDGNVSRLKKAVADVEEVAEFLGLTSLLYVQAGERSSYTHALVSLGHCLLKCPDIIVAQEVHVGMPPEHLQAFRDKAQAAIKKLGAGVLYLSSSKHEGSGLEFSRTYEIECNTMPDVGDIW